MLKAKKMPIQNMQFALMIITIFSRQEMISGTWLATLRHTARKHAKSNLQYRSANKSKRFEGRLIYEMPRRYTH
jgi:hypothetical protein